jgi:hypothetical protein
MVAVYPAALVTTTDIPDMGANLSTNPHTSLHNKNRDEIVAIEAELGVAPSGSYSTVKARLDKGWQPITAASFSAAATVDITIPASTYYWVQIAIVLTSPGGIGNLQARVNNDSTAALHEFISNNLIADAAVTSTVATTAWNIGTVGTEQSVTILNIYSADASSVCPFQSTNTKYAGTEANARAGFYGGQLAAARTLSSVRIFPAASTITGRYTALGYVP